MTKIKVLTVSNQPVIDVGNFSAKEIDDIVRSKYGFQKNGSPHNWEGLAPENADQLPVNPTNLAS